MNNQITANILLRYATYSQWMRSPVILQQGEAAIAVFPDEDPQEPPRAFGIKIGDGERYFRELPWIQALAADVFEWAKDPTKPTYSATEIIGLDEYINAHSQGGGSGGSSSASNAYRIIYDANSSKYILQVWDEENQEWTSTSSEIDLASILNRLNTIERWANGALINLGNIEVPLASYVYDEVISQLSVMNFNDEPVEGQYVTAVSQYAGTIEVTREPFNISNVEVGVLSTQHGGTGLSQVFEDEALVGSFEGEITKKPIVTVIEDERDAFATAGAIKDYVDQKTAGLTGAMHFIGESTVPIDITVNNRVNPQIAGYNFYSAQPGDVILANNKQEYVWSGSEWILLGDEGSYAIKGSIKDADISEDAAIAQSKINGLTDSLDGKVDKVEGKQLSTNDYTTEEKEALDTIYNGDWENTIEHIVVNGSEVQPNEEKAVNLTIPELTEEQLNLLNNLQPNPIEHIFINGVEAEPITYDQTPKSINIEHVLTAEEKEKLDGIEDGAEVNKVEGIIINDGEPITPADDNIDDKYIRIELDPATLNLSVIEGARYPTGVNTYTDIDITDKKLELSKIAATGDIDDLVQTENTFIIINCGSSTEVMNNGGGN